MNLSALVAEDLTKPPAAEDGVKLTVTNWKMLKAGGEMYAQGKERAYGGSLKKQIEVKIE